jgi:hypothetical protein
MILDKYVCMIYPTTIVIHCERFYSTDYTISALIGPDQLLRPRPGYERRRYSRICCLLQLLGLSLQCRGIQVKNRVVSPSLKSVH